jgi:hypothetical protein
LLLWIPFYSVLSGTTTIPYFDSRCIKQHSLSAATATRTPVRSCMEPSICPTAVLQRKNPLLNTLTHQLHNPPIRPIFYHTPQTIRHLCHSSRILFAISSRWRLVVVEIELYLKSKIQTQRHRQPHTNHHRPNHIIKVFPAPLLYHPTPHKI